MGLWWWGNIRATSLHFFVNPLVCPRESVGIELSVWVCHRVRCCGGLRGQVNATPLAVYFQQFLEAE